MNRPSVPPAAASDRAVPAWPPAPCRFARRLAAVIIAGGLMLVVAIAADLLLRSPAQDVSASRWMNRLHLSSPALWPAGSSRRHPESIHPGIDLRYGPELGGAR